MVTKIMIDSASDFTQKEASELGLLFVPIVVQFGEDEFFDGIDLSVEEFYNKLENSQVLPKTSLINSYRWGEAFKEATADGSQLVVITLSSKISGTFAAAVEASKNFENVYVVDSLNAAFGEAVLALYALKLKEQGLQAKEIAEKLNEEKQNICIYALVDTLKYLKKGGRISATSAAIGTMLSVKPLVGIVDGEVKMLGKAMGTKKGNIMLNSFIDEAGGIDFDRPYGYIYSGTDKSNLEKYKLESEELLKGNPISEHALGCTIGSHAGPGVAGIVFFKKNKKEI